MEKICQFLNRMKQLRFLINSIHQNSHLKSNFVLLFQIFILSFFIIFCSSLYLSAQTPKSSDQTQTTQQPTQEPEDKAPELQPITASDIPTVSEETTVQLDEIRAKIKPLDELKEIRAKIKPLDELKQIGQNFKELQEEINQMDEQLNATTLEDLKFNRLMSLQSSWESVKTSMTDWQNKLQTRSQELEGYSQILLEKNQLWELTKTASQEREDPQALMLRIREVMESINEVDKELKKRQEAVLTLMDQVSQESILTNKALTKINEGLSYSREKIFAIDSPPLWKAFKLSEQKNKLSEQMKQTWDSRLTVLSKFFEDNWFRMIFHLALFIIISLFFLNVRRRGESLNEAEVLDTRFKYIYHYSFSSALLLSLVFTSNIYPRAPQFILELNRLLALIPLMRILPKLIEKEMRAPLFGLAALYILQRLDELIIDFTLAHRLVLLLITLIGFIGIIWILRSGGSLSKQDGGKWWQAMIFLSKIALILLGVSIFSNIFGNVSLADLLTGAILNIAFVSVALFTAILILESIIVISFQSATLSKLRIIKNNAQLIETRLISFSRLLAAILWIRFSLRSLKIYDPLKEFAINILTESLKVGNISFTLGDILIFIVTIWFSFLLSRFIRFILQEDILPRIPLPRGVPASISILTNYVILFFGFLIALSAAGIDMSKFALLAGAFGVGIGFGLQNVVNNFISGLILIFERPIKLGDTVEVGTLVGVVKRIGIRSSTIRTFAGAEVIVPNGTLIQSEVTNWTLSDRLRRIEVKVGVAYGSDPNQVLEILYKVAKDNPVVLENPAPMMLFQGFGESSLDFSFRVWTSDYDNWLSFSSEIAVEVHNALKAAGIKIPFPQRDLHVRSVAEDVPQQLKPSQKKSDSQSKKTES
jgi:small-conductance mechanosensitive channel